MYARKKALRSVNKALPNSHHASRQKVVDFPASQVRITDDNEPMVAACLTGSIAARMTDPASPVGIRLLINRKVLAAYRHRTAAARRLEMSESEISALTHLAEGGMTPGELGRRLQLTSGGMTALLHRLDRAGHIIRRPHPTDRRSVIVSANPVVLANIGELYAPLVADADEITSRLSKRERESISRYLQTVVASSERRAEELVADAEAAEVEPDDDALHLWA